jgi:predicted transcriptional regulator
MNIKKIVHALEELNLTLNKFASECEISYATLYDITHGKTKNPRIETVAKISKALNIPITELLNKEE